MDLARRLSTALYGATEKGTGLETADVNDQETLDKLRDDAKKQARNQIAADLKSSSRRRTSTRRRPRDATRMKPGSRSCTPRTLPLSMVLLPMSTRVFSRRVVIIGPSGTLKTLRSASTPSFHWMTSTHD